MNQSLNHNSEVAAAVKVEGVGYTYRGAHVPALTDVSLTMEQGQCFGLLGPNGAGKTTLLSILMGLLDIQSGAVEINGQPVVNNTMAKRHCAIVPQDYAFYPMLTGRENLDFFAGLSGMSGVGKQERIREIVRIAGLNDVLDQLAETYSGGIKRRLNLAIGLLNNPDILFLDEPTVGIDAQSRHFILEAINRLKQGGMTVVYTSHYMEEVQAICDKVAIIDHGRLLIQDYLEALLANQSNNLAIVRLHKPLSEAQLSELRKTFDISLHESSLHLSLTDGIQPLESLLSHLRKMELEVSEIRYGNGQLEDVYLALTNKALRE